MIETKTCINVWSDMNTWIDFCIITESDIELAKEIIQQAYDDWWELEDVQFEPLGDYVSRCLYEKGTEFEIYFKNEEEDQYV